MPFSSQQQGGSSGGSSAVAAFRNTISYIFEALARYNTTASGGGTISITANGVRLITNASSGAVIGLISNFPYTFPIFDRKPSFNINVQTINGEAGSGFYSMGIVDNTGSSDQIYETVGGRKGVWITKKVAAGVVTWYACVCDGSAITATPFTMSSNNGPHGFTIQFTDEGVKFYADNVLKATVTTNIPTGGNSTFQSGLLYIFVKNNSGDSSQRIFDVANAQINYES